MFISLSLFSSDVFYPCFFSLQSILWIGSPFLRSHFPLSVSSSIPSPIILALLRPFVCVAWPRSCIFTSMDGTNLNRFEIANSLLENGFLPLFSSSSDEKEHSSTLQSLLFEECKINLQILNFSADHPRCESRSSSLMMKYSPDSTLLDVAVWSLDVDLLQYLLSSSFFACLRSDWIHWCILRHCHGLRLARIVRAFLDPEQSSFQHDTLNGSIIDNMFFTLESMHTFCLGKYSLVFLYVVSNKGMK